MSNSYFPRWRLADDAEPGVIIAPDERLSWPKNVAMGAQHVVAMFGSTVLAPLLMGFDPNVAILMSGIGTLIFFLFVGGRGMPAAGPTPISAWRWALSSPAAWPTR
ncbi:hypothetical protein G6F57_019482 [Rhizopus arrhizus]|nr:hypothetical protein G6F57_019482 [Rhizopus arrhizus]